MPIRAVLIDAFGTVIHAEPEWESKRADCLRAVHGTWTRSAIPLTRYLDAYEAARAAQHAEVERGYREFDFAERFNQTMRACGAQAAEAKTWGPVAAEAYHRFQERLIHAYDDSGATLARLKAEGFQVAMVSNYGHTGVLDDALTRLGIRHHFDALVVSADVGLLKPHPAIFDAALAALGATKREAVMIGNDLTCDISGAKRAGFKTIWTPYPRASPAPAHPDADAVVERLSDLPDAIAKLA